MTAAARAGADVWKIQQISRHASMQELSGYNRDARLFNGHAGGGFLYQASYVGITHDTNI